MPDLGLTRLREQHTRDKAITSICGECGWPFPCATVRLLDRLAALEEAVNGARNKGYREGRQAAWFELLEWTEQNVDVANAALAGTPKP